MSRHQSHSIIQSRASVISRLHNASLRSTTHRLNSLPLLNRSAQMATSLAETLAVKFPGGLPPWVDPLLNAARRIEVVEKREQQHALVSSDVKTKPSKKTKKTSTKTNSRKSKADVDGDVQDDEAGLGDDVTDEEMIKKAQEYLESVRSQFPNDQ